MNRASASRATSPTFPPHPDSDAFVVLRYEDPVTLSPTTRANLVERLEARLRAETCPRLIMTAVVSMLATHLAAGVGRHRVRVSRRLPLAARGARCQFDRRCHSRII